MEFDIMTPSIKKVVFPVGGLGKRFYPATIAIPKEMLPVVDRPLIDYAIEEARLSGIEELIFVTRKGKSSIEDYIEEYIKSNNLKTKSNVISDNNKVKELSFSFTMQHESLGLGHAIWCARNLIRDEPFAVILPDELFVSRTPCLHQLLKVYEDQAGYVLGLGEIPIEQSGNYGIVSFSNDNGAVVKIDGMVEKPLPKNAPSNLSIIGRYILQPEIFKFLESAKRSIGGEIQLTDTLAQLVNNKPFHGVRCKGDRFDCGSKAGLIKANIVLGLERKELHDEVSDFIMNFKRKL